jgi:hypothetical protein
LTMDITLHMMSTNGDWFFIGHRTQHTGDDSEEDAMGGCGNACNKLCEFWYESRDYRDEPDPVTFDPFLAAFAKAVQKMPVLEYFMLTSELAPSKDKFCISYHAPGRTAEWGDEDAVDSSYRRVYYACKAWRPEPKTMVMLGNLGKMKFGGEVIERFLGNLHPEDLEIDNEPRSP